ncbi:MAG TPA: DUF3857 domain-containing protein [Candidatus Acidoferrales bacterium]|nr:DUF3857 domain-containing protein [Candidatus Acidoferrales bacterium]
MKSTETLACVKREQRRSTARRLGQRISLLGLVVFFVLAVPAQAQSVAPWPPVTPEEQAFREVPGVAGAPAAILYREVQTDDEKRFETHFYRIKILTEKGKKYADVEIPYVMKVTEVDDIRARTIQSNGATADFHGQIFDRLVAKARKISYQARVFTIPDANVGTIIDYAYTLRWKENIPEVIKKPGQYVITGASSFLTSRWTVHDELFMRRAHFALRPVPNGKIVYTWVGLPANFKPVTNPDGTVSLDVQDFPAFIEEEFMPPEKVLKARVDLFYLVGWAPNVQVFWSYQAKQGADIIEKFIGDPKDVARHLQGVVAVSDAPDVKLRKIYDRVQRIRALNYEPSRTEKERKREGLGENKSAEDVLRHGWAYGNEINFAFVALARAAGFKAVIAEVTSRSSDAFARQVLDTSQLNAMVVVVTLDSRKIYLDPATRYCPFGLLPWYEADTEGIVLSGEGDPFIRTGRSTSDDAVVERKLDVKLDGEGNSLSGTLAFKFTGQEALNWRLSLLNEDEPARRKEIEDFVKEQLPAGSTVEVAGVVNQEAVNEPLLINTRVQIPQFTTRAGRRVLLPAGVLQTQSKNQFQSTTRHHPVYFRHPYRLLDDVRIELPAELTVENLPQPKSENIATLVFDSKYERSPAPAGHSETVLHFLRKQEIGTYYFPASNYHQLREFFARVHAADEQQVVLVPAQPVAVK